MATSRGLSVSQRTAISTPHVGIRQVARTTCPRATARGGEPAAPLAQRQPDGAAAPVMPLPRRQLLQGAAVAAAAVMSGAGPAAAAPQGGSSDFVTTDSGLKIEDVRAGEGASPRLGDRVSVHWSGYTKGYQGKRIDNTSVRDEPYEFTLGAGQAIKAFEEAVAGMKVGGIRRIEVPGEHPELGYSRDRSVRFTDELISPDLKIFKYRVGPQPSELGGQRALDFVLDNDTLQPFNRTLLFDIKLLAVRPAPGSR